MPPQTALSLDTIRAERCIGLGLITLIAAPWLLIAPAVSAVALICLGTTEITTVRFRGKSTLKPILLLHAAVYTALYVIFVAVTLLALFAQHPAWLNVVAILDLIFSAFPMAIALRQIMTPFTCTFRSRR